MGDRDVLKHLVNQQFYLSHGEALTHNGGHYRSYTDTPGSFLSAGISRV